MGLHPDFLRAKNVKIVLRIWGKINDVKVMEVNAVHLNNGGAEINIYKKLMLT